MLSLSTRDNNHRIESTLSLNSGYEAIIANIARILIVKL